MTTPKVRSNKAESTTEVEINGKKAQVLVADLNGDQKLAVVDQSVLQRLVDMLPRTNLTHLKEELCSDIMGAKDIKEICDIMVEELQFHKSVNLIETFFLPRDHVNFDDDKVNPVEEWTSVIGGIPCRDVEGMDGLKEYQQLHEIKHMHSERIHAMFLDGNLANDHFRAHDLNEQGYNIIIRKNARAYDYEINDYPRAQAK